MPDTPDPPAPTWTARIDDGRVAVFDGLLGGDGIAKLHHVLLRSGYTRSEIARPDTAEYRHWATEIPLSSLPQMPFLAPTLAALRAIDPGHRWRPYRSYVNVAHFGDMLFTHTDCLPGAGEITALWYVCEHWDIEWGGETVFFDGEGEIRAAVMPRPGRLAIFDGHLRHAGRPPQRVHYGSRFTLALKLERAEAAAQR
ncbi:MAG: 2OG-Fe(II) oxygenase [Rubrivivax sp.]